MLLFKMLQQFNFATEIQSHNKGQELMLDDCRITNAVKCLPPQNKPIAQEIAHCNDFLSREIGSMTRQPAVILALGRVAHNAVLKALCLKQVNFPFGHARQHLLSTELLLVDSYHCSRYNMQTRRLTEDMFQQLFQQIRQLLND